MAVSTQRSLPAQFIEDLGKDYGTQLAGLTAVPLDTGKFAPSVAAQDPLQAKAYQLGEAGIGAYQPYITQAGAYSGPTAYQSFMSPYQQQVIDATLTEYDKQAGKGLQSIADLATRSGNLGGGREGVMRSEYQTQSDLNRAMLQSGLLQQGFGQAQQLAGQAFGQQMQLGQQLPALQQQDISTVGTLGATQQAQQQAVLDAQREANRLTAYEPYERLGTYGAGITGLISGYPGRYQSAVTPNPTPLQTALGTMGVLSGVYGNIGRKGNTAMPDISKISDIRLKTDIELTGQSPAGVNIYSFRYKGDDKTYEGVMAQEVPWASIKGDDGYYRVDYSKVDVEFKRLN